MRVEPEHETSRVDYTIHEETLEHAHAATDEPAAIELHLRVMHGRSVEYGTLRGMQRHHRRLHAFDPADPELFATRRLDVEARGSGHPSRPGTIRLERPTMAELMDLIDTCEHVSVWQADPDNEG